MSWYIFTAVYGLLSLLYIVIGVNNPKKLWKLVLKCLPILVLASWVLLCLATEPQGTGTETVARLQVVLWGLVFSCIGDGCLVFPRVAPLGLLSFAVAQCIYIYLFGLSVEILLHLPHYSLISALAVGIASTLIFILFHRQLRSFRISMFPLLRVGVFIYFVLISVFVWGAVLRFLRIIDLASFVGAVGALLFYVSDILIAASAVWKVQVLQGRALIMGTYFTAQLFIILSVY